MEKEYITKTLEMFPDEYALSLIQINKQASACDYKEALHTVIELNTNILLAIHEMNTVLEANYNEIEELKTKIESLHNNVASLALLIGEQIENEN